MDGEAACWAWGRLRNSYLGACRWAVVAMCGLVGSGGGWVEVSRGELPSRDVSPVPVVSGEGRPHANRWPEVVVLLPADGGERQLPDLTRAQRLMMVANVKRLRELRDEEYAERMGREIVEPGMGGRGDG